MNLVIGTANFLKIYGFSKKKIGRKEIKKILDFCLKKKLKFIDTAFSYDQFAKIKGINFDKFKISSKLIFEKNEILNLKIDEYCKLLRKKILDLKIKKFDNLFIHNFDDLSKKKLDRAIQVMKCLKNKNLINKIGISIYNEKSIKKTLNYNCIDIIQAPLSLCDRRFAKKKYIKYLKKKKIKIQARSIFLQGLLLGNSKELAKVKFVDKAFMNRFDEWSKNNMLTKKLACLNFIKNQKYLNSFVLGIENLNQLKEIIFLSERKNGTSYPKNISSKKRIFFDPRKW